MKSIKRLVVVSSLLALITVSSISFADTTQMNTSLERIRMILRQVNPLINLAEQQQDPNARVQFQFKALRQDVGRIQAGIAQSINRVSIQPRVVKPLSGDYLPVPKSILKEEKPIYSGNTP